MNFTQIKCVADKSSSNACQALEELNNQHSHIISKNEDCDLVVVLGGDGFMLHNIHKYMGRNIPLYGMNCGNIGFLMNKYDKVNLIENINCAKSTKLKTLSINIHSIKGSIYQALAVNEISLLRKTYQTANIRITIDGVVQIDKLISDGILLSTPTGSGAYNSSVGGAILPMCANLLSLMPISPFRPRGWKGALLSDKSRVTFEVMDPIKRPVSAVADFVEFRNNICRVEIEQSTQNSVSLLFNSGYMLEDRILNEQFSLSCV